MLPAPGCNTTGHTQRESLALPAAGGACGIPNDESEFAAVNLKVKLCLIKEFFLSLRK